MKISDEQFVEAAVNTNTLSQAEIAALRRGLSGSASGRGESRLADAAVKRKFISKEQVAAAIRISEIERGIKDGPVRFGPYQCLDKLGKGGMGLVYKARQVSNGMTVALKLLSPRVMGKGVYLERFGEEVHNLASLNHPNIVKLFGGGTHADIPYLAMEFVDGESLEITLKARGKVPEQTALEQVAEVSDAIGHIWQEARLVHRDIKPGNIIISKRGEVKLADLGLARVREKQEALSFEEQRATSSGPRSITNTHGVVGTPYYMSPEQLEGKPLDVQSDIYSLGVSLYQLLTGAYPFDGLVTREIILKRFEEEPRDPIELEPSLSPKTCQIVQRMLCAQKSRRYPNTRSLSADLREAAANVLPAGRHRVVVKTHAGSRRARMMAHQDDREPPKEQPTPETQLAVKPVPVSDDPVERALGSVVRSRLEDDIPIVVDDALGYKPGDIWRDRQIAMVRIATSTPKDAATPRLISDLELIAERDSSIQVRNLVLSMLKSFKEIGDFSDTSLP